MFALFAVIDFGGATFENQHKSSIINTRQYRAPEVVLDCGWDVSSDMWSVGCILMEMYTGELLFGTVSPLTPVCFDVLLYHRFPFIITCSTTTWSILL